MSRGEVKSILTLAFNDARVNAGALATITGAMVSYLDVIDHLLRTTSLLLTVAIGVFTLARAIRKHRAG